MPPRPHESVHRFLAALVEQARERGWDLTQLDPPRQASRYVRLDGKLHSVQPYAFGVLRRDGLDQPFFHEWERRAIRPSTMANRLAPYLRYHAARQPTDDQGAPSVLLVVFDDELAADHFRRVAEEERERDNVQPTLFVSNRRRLEQYGPLAPVWNGIDDRCPWDVFAKRG